MAKTNSDSPKVDQSKVTSKAKREGAFVIRTYSDGSVQKIGFDSEDLAKDYAASVAEQEG